MDELLAQLSPEEIQQLLGLGTMDERSELLKQQLAQAEALRSGIAQNHSTGVGGALGGIGDVLTSWSGVAGDLSNRAQQKKLLDEQDQRRQLILKALRGEGAAPGLSDLAGLSGGVG